jgi:3-dehydroquinate synthase
MAHRIEVTSPTNQYPIIIQEGLLDAIIAEPSQYGLNKRVIVATNTTVRDLYAEKLASNLPNADIIAMPDGEAYKTLDTVRDMYDQMIALRADRSTTILALGGGVVGDAMGFVAASYMRGIRLVQMPTTLLAMVDSSVGGKVGVDLPQGKNLVGAFKQPDAVLIDPHVLRTLSPEQWRCGMAEALKHGLIADEGLLDPMLHTPDRAQEFVARAVQVKVDVVQKDPYEQNIRAHLNLGHTFAHAIEQVTHYAWLHGEAVGVGLLLAARLSHQQGLCEYELVTQIETIIAETGLPTHITGLDVNALYEAMHTDKKWRDGQSHFILLAGMNQPRIIKGIPRDDVLAVLSATGAS